MLQTLNVQVGFADHVSDNENDVFRVLLDQSYAIGDAGVLPDRVFDLAQFDPQSPYLDLVILPT